MLNRFGVQKRIHGAEVTANVVVILAWDQLSPLYLLQKVKLNSGLLAEPGVIEATPTANGPEGDCYMGHQTHAGKPAWASGEGRAQHAFGHTKPDLPAAPFSSNV